MTDTARRSESERLLALAAKHLETKDLTGAKDFATSAQESDPLLDGSDQIIAIADVLIAADNKINDEVNWYAILQLSNRCDDLNLLKEQYRKLAILLHPDKNKFPYCRDAFQLVSDAWDVVSDSSKKAVYDKELFGDVEVKSDNKMKQKLNKSVVNFWTACPYCYSLHQYPRVYLQCCLKCNTCGKAIHAVEIPSLPSVVKGKDGFNCFLGCFPMGYVGGSGRGFGEEFPNWMPPLFQSVANVSGGARGGFRNVNVTRVNASAKADFRSLNVPQDEYVTPAPVYANVTSIQKPGTRKRGRPRKNPIM